jgi:hypothetical protein
LLHVVSDGEPGLGFLNISYAGIAGPMHAARTSILLADRLGHFSSHPDL